LYAIFHIQKTRLNWKMKAALDSIPLPSDLPDRLAELGPRFGPQVRLSFALPEPLDVPETDRWRIATAADPWSRPPTRSLGPDLLVTVTCGPATATPATDTPAPLTPAIPTPTTFRFIAQAKSRSTPSTLDTAIRQARQWAGVADRLPMVILPFLDEPRLSQLASANVSGLDLCGNGVITVPGRLMLWRSGQPNRYPDSRPTRFAYRGVTSLTPRVFLRRPQFISVGRIREEIRAAGAQVALSTVSKALARMADDLIIDRSDDRITLLQPDALLDRLAASFTPPPIRRRVDIKCPLPLGEFFRAASAANVPLALSGASSAQRYAAGLRADAPVIYTSSIDALSRSLGQAWQPADRFADLAIIQTDDPTAFFDLRTDATGIRFAPPVQAYLELSASGDKRDQEIALSIRQTLLRDLDRPTDPPVPPARPVPPA